MKCHAQEHQGRRSIASLFTLLAAPSSPWHELCPGVLREDAVHCHPCPSPRLLWLPTTAEGHHPVLFPTVFPLGWSFHSRPPGRSRALVLWPLLASSSHCWCVTTARLRLWRWGMALCSGWKTGAENGPGASASMAALSLRLTVDSSL